MFVGLSSGRKATSKKAEILLQKNFSNGWKQTSDRRIFRSILCVYQRSESPFCHDVFLEKWLHSLEQWKPRVSPHVLTRRCYTSIKRDCGEERLERGRAVTLAHSLLPKTKQKKEKSLQLLTVHIRRVEREMISHQDGWNFYGSQNVMVILMVKSSSGIKLIWCLAKPEEFKQTGNNNEEH